MISLKNYRITREFSFLRFVILLVSGLILPMPVFIQLIAFLKYSEAKTESYDDNKFELILYDQRYVNFENEHDVQMLDYFHNIVGRLPNQDYETAHDWRWFLRQTNKQKIYRIALFLIVVLFYFMVLFNLYFYFFYMNSNKLSLMETIGPFVLYLIVWISYSC